MHPLFLDVGCVQLRDLGDILISDREQDVGPLAERLRERDAALQVTETIDTTACIVPRLIDGVQRKMQHVDQTLQALCPLGIEQGIGSEGGDEAHFFGKCQHVGDLAM